MKTRCAVFSHLPVACTVPLLVSSLGLLLAGPLTAPTTAQMAAMARPHSDQPAPMATPAQMQEKLGAVSFQVSCGAAAQPYFNRGVALLHDFWYEEARRQFERIAKDDPTCAMAHWGEAMSAFHEIWGRPDAAAMSFGWAQIQAAQALRVKTARERAYIAAMAAFYKPGPEQFPARVQAYSAAMGRLYASYPKDVNAGAFYALSLLAEENPGDTSETQERKAMVVLRPLFAKDPDNPGVDHYTIHACDNPAMAREGLAAANHYGEIAPSGPHAAHMPGHIYARLGMWPQDIAAQRASIKASEQAEARGESGIMDEPHSYDFLIYAEMQSGQDAQAKRDLAASGAVLDRLAAMPGKGKAYMAGMVPFYRVELTGFYALEMHDWKMAAAMEPVAGSPADDEMLVDWMRIIADGHLRDGSKAATDLAGYQSSLAKVRKGDLSYVADSTATKIMSEEAAAWADDAEGHQAAALESMGAAADLQDKVGQGEVDIPAREMLADMLLQMGRPKQALLEYEASLRLSPNRLNGLYGAARAAAACGEKAQAAHFYRAMLKSSDGGAQSARPEFAKAKRYLAGTGQPAE